MLLKMQNMIRILPGKRGYLKRALEIQILKIWAPTPSSLSPQLSLYRLNNRGNSIDSVLLNDPNLIRFNDHKSPTNFCVSNGSSSTIDSSSCSTFITWKTHYDLCDSDYFPILQTNSIEHQTPFTSPPKWLLEKADWIQSTHLMAATDSITSSNSVENDVSSFTEFILRAVNLAVPKSTPKPHWKTVPR